jgi:hypothetical protein
MSKVLRYLNECNEDAKKIKFNQLFWFLVLMISRNEP